MFKPIFRHNMTAKIAQFFTDYIDFWKKGHLYV
jgi:hypothetical protein